MKGIDPANCPIRAGSLAAGRTRSAATKPPEGNHRTRLAGWNDGTRSQPERRGEQAGRRQTNDRRHRKGKLASIADRARYIGRRSSVRREKPDTMGEATGREHSMARRCKRQRHAWKTPWCNWGEPAEFRQGNRAMTMRGVGPYQQPRESRLAFTRFSGKEERLGISGCIKRQAESRRHALRGVGDAHSSEDEQGSINCSERRGISLEMLLVGNGGPA